MPDTPIPVETSPLRPVLTALVRQVITALGAYLVTRGIITQSVSDQVVPEVVGLVMVGGSAGWAWWKANHVTQKFAAIDARVSDTIVTSKGA